MTTASANSGKVSDRVVLWTTRALSVLAALLLISMMVLTFVDVWGRYIFNSPVPGGFELTELMLATLIFAGLPLVTIGGEHITVDLIEFSVSPTLERVREGVVSLVCAFMTGVLSYQMWLKALEQLDYGDETAVLQIPVYPVTFFMCLTAALTCLVLVVLAFQQVFGSRNAPASVAH
ncbi:TRAP transporter small permease [Roseibium sp.]|uniref:TRAP transporter small permease n=1 Tax=Roseibium sp. TaxID=1936156 RepID=UPI003A972B10